MGGPDLPTGTPSPSTPKECALLLLPVLSSMPRSLRCAAAADMSSNQATGRDEISTASEVGRLDARLVHKCSVHEHFGFLDLGPLVRIHAAVLSTKVQIDVEPGWHRARDSHATLSSPLQPHLRTLAA